MKIREELSPAKRRMLGIISILTVFGSWVILTLPFLPPAPAPPERQNPGMSTPQGGSETNPEQPESTEPVTAEPGAVGTGTTAPQTEPEAGPSGTGAEGPVTDEAAEKTEGSPLDEGIFAGDEPTSNPSLNGGQEPAGEGHYVRPPITPSVPQPSGPRALIPPEILPSPLAVLAALGKLHREEGLVRSAAVSFWRISWSFILAAAVAIPLGILMGTYPPIRACVEPFSGPLRYLPITAVTGLFILLFGIQENMKIALLFTGTVVYLLPIVVECIMNVDEVYLETAYTLGAKPAQVILRVLVPAAWPGIFEACRVIYGIGWTYVIVAELINAEYGLGHLIQIAYKRGHIDQAYALVLVILLLGVGTNEAFRLTGKKLFAWRDANG